VHPYSENETLSLLLQPLYPIFSILMSSSNDSCEVKFPR
jgi:hypothetical protein